MITDDRPRSGDPTVRVSRQALALGVRHAIESGLKEVGGILVGWWEGPKTAVVHEILVVSDDQSGLNHYDRKHDLAQSVLTKYLSGLEDHRMGYIGEWHSHPAARPPSDIDLEELVAISRRSRRPVVLMVLAVTADDDVIPHVVIGRGRWPHRRALTPAVLERMEP
ncbi:Mov34/MPN/PAD-1 family protein [Kribbella sp. NPDC048928]|uniref:Mov34/MPN/PAD-1 family protein n=1 Tax=Kribbella sp. NPDC048928 TaxID=3364111 RepID=UPI0037190B81